VTQGFQSATSDRSLFNANTFLILQILNRISTATLVRVEAVSNAGEVALVGTVNVKPLVDQVDGSGNTTPHGIIYGLPYFRVQGGTDAVILDPKVGDIGAAIFFDRDVSAVLGTMASAPPGSGRRFDMADGFYLGGNLNGDPQQYLQFNTSGVTITSASDVNINAPGTTTITTQTANITASSGATITTPTLTVDGNMQVNGNMNITGTVTA
jgi:hypothetical protein